MLNVFISQWKIFVQNRFNLKKISFLPNSTIKTVIFVPYFLILLYVEFYGASKDIN